MKIGIFILYALIYSHLGIGQISIATSARFSIEKFQPNLCFEFNMGKDIVLGTYGTIGSLSSYNYREVQYRMADNGGVIYLNNSDITLPYLSENKGITLGGKTIMKGWGIGAFYSQFWNIFKKEENKLVLSFDFEYLNLIDNYTIRATEFMSSEKIITYSGNYHFSSLGLGTKFGYRRLINNKSRFYCQIAIGAAFYYPVYHEHFESYDEKYSFKTPYVGVEYEVEIGIGYYLKKYR